MSLLIARGLDKVTFKGHFQPKLLYDSINTSDRKKHFTMITVLLSSTTYWKVERFSERTLSKKNPVISTLLPLFYTGKVWNECNPVLKDQPKCTAKYCKLTTILIVHLHFFKDQKEKTSLYSFWHISPSFLLSFLVYFT